MQEFSIPMNLYIMPNVIASLPKPRGKQIDLFAVGKQGFIIFFQGTPM
jgi:hypothetical protein